MYGNHNTSFMIDRLMKQKDEIDNMIRNYQNTTQTPVNNFINTNQSQNTPKDYVEWRILNENEEVDNLYVPNKTFFINDNMAILKGVDGSLEKWEVKKIYPKDKKDEKIHELESKIKELEEKVNESAKPIISTQQCYKPYGYDDEHVEPKPKANVEYVSVQER